MLLRIFLIGIGGFFGSILRYLLGGVIQRMIAIPFLPLGTFAVNITGCFAIGFLYFRAETHGVLTGLVRAMLITGFLGGFTTFSAFANESFNLMRNGETLLAGINIVGQITLCLIAVWAGRYLAYLIWR